MNIWNYDPITGELLGETQAVPDPTPEGIAVGRYMIPAYATSTEPPDAESGHARVFSSGSWTQVVDDRGQTWWNGQTSLVITALGDPTTFSPPLTSTQPTPPTPPPPTPQQLYDAAIAAGITLTWTTSTTLDGTYAIDQGTQFNITAESVSILMNSTFSNGTTTRNWADQSGDFHGFTIAQFRALATAVAQYIDGITTALIMALADGAPTWPNSNVTIDL